MLESFTDCLSFVIIKSYCVTKLFLYMIKPIKYNELILFFERRIMFCSRDIPEIFLKPQIPKSVTVS